MSFAPWQFHIRQLLVPKAGSDATECEDAIALNEQKGRFAVADGATEAYDARRWAAQLADGWARGDESALSPDDFRRWVSAQGEQLHAAWHARQLPWYAEEKARRGSFAAFIGLQIESADGGALCWRAIALGDACFFLQRGDELRVAFPLADARSFHSYPLLVPSQVAQQQAALEQTATAAGPLVEGDVCWLLSDAVAAWYLHKRAAGDRILREFESLLVAARRDNLMTLLAAENRAGTLRDDDYAVVRISIRRGA